MPQTTEDTLNKSDFAIRRFQCRHIFTDGHRCGSPCLRGEDFCFYHHSTRRAKPAATSHDPYNEPPNQTAFTLPIPEDRSAIQHSIGQIMNQLAGNALDPRRAGLLLYALQIASLNLKDTSRRVPASEAHDPRATVEEITIDPILGPLAPEAEMRDLDLADPLQALLTHLEHLDTDAEQPTAPKLEVLEATEAPEDTDAPSATTGLTLQAAAATPRQPSSTPVSPVSDVLYAKSTPGRAGYPSRISLRAPTCRSMHAGVP